jgi:hypothetical protein
MVSRARLLARASYFRVSLKVFPVGLLTKCRQDALSQLAHITAPTQITFGRHDTADTLKNGIVGSVRLMERRRLPLLLPGRTVSGSG